MPLLKIQTNAAVLADQLETLLSQGTDLVVNEMNKPRDYVKLLVEPDE